MPSTSPKLISLLPPVDGRPLSRQEWQELRATRLALVTFFTVSSASTFLEPHRPLPGGPHSDLRWLHDNLAPLDSISPTVRRIRALLDPLRYNRELNDPERVRLFLRRISQDTRLLASTHAASTPPSSRRRG